jgi:hypothetical protein
MKLGQSNLCRAWLCTLVGGCATISPPRDIMQDTEQSHETGAGHPGGSTPTTDHRASLGFVLEATLRARRLHRDHPIVLLELANGSTVLDRDRLQMYVRTSQDAYLNVAFCSQHADDRRFAGLKVFPDVGALRVRAYETAIVPDRMAEIVLDDKPGPEAIYLVLSRVELSTSDAELAQLIASARRGHELSDCTGPLKGPTRDVRPDGTPAPPPPRKAPIPGKRPTPSRGPSASPSGTSKTPPPRPEDEPVVELQRGGDIVWNHDAIGLEADPAGIVVLRYGLTHVAAPEGALPPRPRR